MSYYYIIDSNTREVVRESRTPFNIDPAIQPPDPYLQLVRVDDDRRPAFDEATQKLVREFVDDDAAFTRTFRFVVAPMTAEEIAAYQRRQADTAELQQLRAVYQDLQNGVGTSTERMRRVERVCAWLLKDYARENFK